MDELRTNLSEAVAQLDKLTIAVTNLEPVFQESSQELQFALDKSKEVEEAVTSGSKDSEASEILQTIIKGNEALKSPARGAEGVIDRALSGKKLTGAEKEFLGTIDNISVKMKEKVQELRKELKGVLSGPDDKENEKLAESLAFFDKIMEERVTAALEKTNESARQLADSLEGAVTQQFENLVKTGEFSAKAIGDAFVDTALEIATEKLISKPLENLFDTLFSNIFGFAGGGKVAPGPVLVGERGPEIFIPDVTGRIVNNHDSRQIAGGQTVQVNQNNMFTTDVQNSVRAEVLALAPAIAEKARIEVIRGLRRERR